MKPVWSRTAREELIAADHYHAEQDRDVADRLVAAARAAARFLAENPSAGETVEPDGRRKWRVRGTPYLILYRRVDTELRILHFVHAARDWQRFL